MTLASLHVLRNEIDEIDRKLHDLLMRRIAIGREVAQAKGKNTGSNLRPGREAQILQGLAARNEGPLSMRSVARIWREILSANLNQQTQIRAAVFAPNTDFYAMAIEYVGTASKLLHCDSQLDVLKDVAGGVAEIGILPSFSDKSRSSWWFDLMEYNKTRKLNIIGQMPIIATGNNNSEGFIIAAQDPEQSRNDTTVFVVKGNINPGVGRVIDDLGGWKLIFVDGYQDQLDVLIDLEWARIGVFSNPISEIDING